MQMDPIPGDNHVHVWVVVSATGTVQDTALTLESADGRSPYGNVLWIKKIYMPTPEPVASVDQDHHPQIPDALWHSTTLPAPPEFAPILRAWSLDRCGVTLWGKRVGADGYSRPVTLHPVRANALVGVGMYAHEEVCRRHLGHLVIGKDGYTRLAFCHSPDDPSDVLNGRGMAYVPATADNHGRAGSTRRAAMMQLPMHHEAFFHSFASVCGGPT